MSIVDFNNFKHWSVAYVNCTITASTTVYLVCTCSAITIYHHASTGSSYRNTTASDSHLAGSSA